MKRVMLLLLLLLSASFSSYSESITDFRVSMAIHHEGYVTVVEHITVRFDRLRHGIFREIPVRYRLPTGERYGLRVELVEVLADGASVPVRRSTEDGYLVLQIGDPDRVVSGEVAYRIEYRIERALRRYGDEVELYWNPIGHEWDMPIESASVEIRLPEGVDPEQVSTTGFIGVAGSRAPFALEWEQGVLRGAAEDLGPGEGITIGVRLPADAVDLAGMWQGFLWFLADNAYAAIPLLTLLGMMGWWFYRGRSPEKGSVSPVFTRPKDLGPAEAGTMVDDRVNTRDITAGIVDLAVKGHLRIREIWDDTRDKEPQDFELELLQSTEAPTAFEQGLLDALFQGEESRKLSELRYELYEKIPGLSARLYMDLTERKYYDGNPDRVRSGYRTVGFIAIAGGILGGGSGRLPVLGRGVGGFRGGGTGIRSDHAAEDAPGDGGAPPSAGAGGIHLQGGGGAHGVRCRRAPF